MRQLSAEACLHFFFCNDTPPTETRIHTVALYSAFALIAAVVFGTLSIHPF